MIYIHYSQIGLQELPIILDSFWVPFETELPLPLIDENTEVKLRRFERYTEEDEDRCDMSQECFPIYYTE